MSHDDSHDDDDDDDDDDDFRGGDGAVIDSSRRTPLYYAVEKARGLLCNLHFAVLSFEQNVHLFIIGIHTDSADFVRV